MNNVYNKLNDLEIEFEEFELNEIEVVSLKKLAKRYSKKNSKFPKIVGLAATLVLLMGLVSPNVRAAVVDFSENIKVTLFENIFASEKANDFVIEIHDMVDTGESTFIFESFAMDEDTIYFMTLVPSAKLDLRKQVRNVDYIVVNGMRNRIKSGEIGSMEVPDNSNFLKNVYVYDMEHSIPMDEDIDIEIHFEKKQLSYGVTLDGFSYKLHIPKEKMLSKTLNIVKDFEIPNSDGTMVNYIKLNPIVQSAKITTRLADVDQEGSFRLVGIDQKSRSIEFFSRKSIWHEFILYFEPSYSDVTVDELLTDVNVITFTLYKKTGHAEENREQIGNSFTISVSK